MKVLELRPYNSYIDQPKTGWDEMAIHNALVDGKSLYVDQFGDVWTSGRREYVGKIS